MVSTFTVNLGLEELARGDLVGVWDTPENNNAALLDLVVGGTTTIPLINSNVALSASQYQCRRLVFTGVLTAAVIIVFPTGFRKSYEVENLCTNAQTYQVFLSTAVVGTEYISAPPGEIVEVANTGGDLKYKNMGRIGEYWDYAGTGVPAWVSGCGIYGISGTPLWLNCDGGAFSAVTYPILANVLGGTTLPDSRGRARAALNQTTGRMTAAGGVNGDTKLAAGGFDYNTLAAASIPSLSAVNPSQVFFSDDTGLVRLISGAFANEASAVINTNRAIVSGGQATCQPSISGTVNVNSNNTSGSFHPNAQPTYTGGLTLIRAK